VYKLFISNTTNSAIEGVIDELGRNNVNAGAQHVVLCPPNYGWSIEKLVHERLGLEGSFNIKVTSFARLARELIRVPRKRLGKEGAVLLMYQVLSEIGKDLVHYDKIAGDLNFASKIYGTMKLLIGNDITEEDIAQKTEGKKGATINKLKDLGVVMKAYKEKKKDRYIDDLERQTLLAENIENGDYFKGKNVYIVGFNDLSELELAIVREVEKKASSVNIALCRQAGDLPNATLFPNKMIGDISGLIASEGASVEDINLSEVLRAPIDKLYGYIFSYSSATSKTEKTEKIKVFKEPNVYEEINAVAHEICRLVNREGYRYKDITIVSCCDKYQKEIAHIFDRYNIPVFVNINFPLSQAISTMFLISCLDVAKYNYRADKVTAFIKHPLFLNVCWEENRITSDDIFKFENYILEKNIKHNAFLEPITDNEVFETIRKRLVSLVNPFNEAAKDSGKALVKASIQLLSEVQEVQDNLIIKEQRGKENQGQIEEANKKAYGILKDLLKENEELFANEKMDVRTFEKHIKTLFSQRQIAMLPRFLDSVFVGDMLKDCILRSKIIFVVGASSSNMTAMLPGELLSQRDMDNLEKIPMQIYPTDKDIIQRAKFKFIDLLSKFTDKFYISCSDYNLSGESDIPSDAYKEIANMLGIKPESLLAEYGLDKLEKINEKNISKLEDICCTQENTLFTLLANINVPQPEEKLKVRSDLLSAMYASLDSDRQSIVSPKSGEECEKPCSGYLSKLLKPVSDGKYSISASRLEAYFNCPYNFFIKYGAKAEKRKEGGLEITDVGTIIHGVLEKYFSSVKNLGLDYVKLQDDEATMFKLLDEALSSVLAGTSNIDAFNDDPTNALVMENLKEELKNIVKSLTSNVAKGSYRPEDFEMAFNEGNGLAPNLEVEDEDGNKYILSINGVIDRVDLYTEDGEPISCLVIDYKSGKGCKENHQASRICTGLAIQPYIYLMAVRKKFGPVKAGGALYLPLADSLNKEGISYNYAGILVSEPDNLKLVDSDAYLKAVTFKDLTESEVLPFNIKYVKKRNQVETTGRNHPAQEYGDMDYIMAYVSEIIKQASKDIDSGFLEKCPTDSDACEYCYVRDACLGAPIENIRQKINKGEANKSLANKTIY
jgi:ATP-dependent helicase/nuclease subunit B